MLWLKLTLFVMLQAPLRSEVARCTFQKYRNPRLCNISRDCIFKIAHVTCATAATLVTLLAVSSSHTDR